MVSCLKKKCFITQIFKCDAQIKMLFTIIQPIFGSHFVYKTNFVCLSKLDKCLSAPDFRTCGSVCMWCHPESGAEIYRGPGAHGDADSALKPHLTHSLHIIPGHKPRKPNADEHGRRPYSVVWVIHNQNSAHLIWFKTIQAL